MDEHRDQRPSISLRGQITLYVIVVAVALLFGTYVGFLYSDFARALVRTMENNGIRPETRAYKQIMHTALFGQASMVGPVAVIAIIALVCWGLCLFGLRAAARRELPVASADDAPKTISD